MLLSSVISDPGIFIALLLSSWTILAAQGTEAPKFTTFQKRSGMAKDLARALLIALSLVVAAALVLVLLPQPTVDKVAQHLESRHQTAQPEKIAFLYLGDEIVNSQFHIRGAVRNITASPIEQLDAVVRFYTQDRSLLETTIVRMDKETIGPNEIAQFELVYPNDRLEFAGYSTEFKLRQGEFVPYKDLRTVQRSRNHEPVQNQNARSQNTATCQHTEFCLLYSASDS